MRSPPPIRIGMEPLTQNWRIFFPLFSSFYSSSSSSISFTIIIALEGEWRKEGRKNKKKKGGKRKIAPLWVHSLLDGFMNSARSHLKDYIREGSRNERGRRERSFSIATAPIPAILYDIVHPRPSLLSPHNLEEEKEEEERGNFELLFDDDASPARAVALFYRRLRDRDIDWDSRNSAKGPPYKSLKRDLCRRGASREEFGELGIPTTFQVVGPRSRICTNPAKDVLLRIRKRNLSFEEGGDMVISCT